MSVQSSGGSEDPVLQLWLRAVDDAERSVREAELVMDAAQERFDEAKAEAGRIRAAVAILAPEDPPALVQDED